MISHVLSMFCRSLINWHPLIMSVVLASLCLFLFVSACFCLFLFVLPAHCNGRHDATVPGPGDRLPNRKKQFSRDQIWSPKMGAKTKGPRFSPAVQACFNISLDMLQNTGSSIRSRSEISILECLLRTEFIGEAVRSMPAGLPTNLEE